MMLTTLTKVATLSTLATTVWGHAVVQTPAPREGGPVHEAQCGAAVAEKLENDLAGPIENALALADDDYNCDLYLCRGYTYEDNTDNVRVVKAGDVLAFHVDMVAGHRPGSANVSIIDLAANAIIGEPLKTWAEWPGNNTGPDRDDINFSVTIPESTGASCAKAGLCALQWFWFVPKGHQTYESCLDFYVEA